MKHYVRPFGAVTLWTLISIPATAAAPPHGDIDEVIISASPHGKSSGDIAGSLNVLSGNTLRRDAAATLGETLKGQTGINSSSFGPGVGLPVIRGLSGSRVEILQNNSPVADASQTSPDHAIALEPLLADRIEILRGPATLRYGPGATGGVVNIIDNRIHTQPHEGLDGALEARFNDNNDGTAYVGRFDGGLGNINLHLSGLLRDNNNMEIPGRAVLHPEDADETTDGFVANTDAKSNAWSLGLSHVTDNLVIGFGMSKIDNNYGIPPGGHGNHEHEEYEHDEVEDDHDDEPHEVERGEDTGLFTRIDMNQTEYSGKLLVRDLPGVFEKLDIDLTHSEYRHRELEIEDGVVGVGTRYNTQEDQFRAEVTHYTGDWQGALGLQIGKKAFEAAGEEAFVPPNDVTITGLFATEEKDSGSSTLALGIRFDRQTAGPNQGREIDHNLFNAGASYLYPLSDTHQLSFTYSHSQRAPTAEELFADGEHAATNSYQVGDKRLDRESSNSLEFTWSWEGPLRINTSLFHREFSDFIFEAQDGSRFSHRLEEEGFGGADLCATDLGEFDNSAEKFDEAVPCYFYRQEDARFTGMEVEAIALISDSASVRFWGDTVRARLSDSGDVPRIPPARLGTNLDFSRGMWVAGIGLTHAFEQNNPGTNETRTDAYTRVDAHISVGNEQWTLFLKGSNLSDEEIRNATSFLRELAPEAGRTFEMGVRVTY